MSTCTSLRCVRFGGRGPPSSCTVSISILTSFHIANLSHTEGHKCLVRSSTRYSTTSVVMSDETEVDESLSQGVEHLKTIFDLCDRDRDGCISAEEFRTIGLEHFGDTQELEQLICEIDPDNSQLISFDMFLKGIQTYIVQHHQLPGSGSICSLSSCTEDNNSTAEVNSTGGYDSAFSSEDVYPLDHRFTTYLSSGYESSTSKDHYRQGEVELVVEPCEDTALGRGEMSVAHSSSSPNHRSGSPTSVSRESPTLIARSLMRKHQLMVESPSQGSTPAEAADLEVSKLSDQLYELTSKLEDLHEDHRDSEGFRNKLKRENTDLKTRLEEYEGELRDKEETTQKMLNDSQNLLKSSLDRARRESEKQLLDVQSQLELERIQAQKMKDTEYTLRSQLSMVEEELSCRESDLSETEEAKRRVEEELRKTRELLRVERQTWAEQCDGLKQELQDREGQVQQLQCECEEAHRDKDSNAIFASDMGREIEQLKKELEQAHLKNEEMQAKFIQEGKELLQRNRESLAAEMDNASKDEVLKALQDSEDLNHRLQNYIDKLLTNIIEKYPQLLEIH